MTENEKLIHGWLSARTPPLAEVFEGVCREFSEKRAGWTRFVAHGLREIINRLPFFLRVAEDEQEDPKYHEHIEAIQKTWRDLGLPTTTLELRPTLANAQNVAVDGAALESIIKLFEARNKRQAWNNARDVQTVTAILESVGHAGPAPSTTVKQWHDLRQPGHRIAHVDRGSLDADMTQDAQKYFQDFQTCLLALITQPVPALESLDEVLDAANK